MGTRRKDEPRTISADSTRPDSAVDVAAERGFIQDIEHPQHGPIRLPGWAPIMEKSSVPMKAVPLLGEHTQEALCDELGIEGDEFSRVEVEGIVSVLGD